MSWSGPSPLLVWAGLQSLVVSLDSGHRHAGSSILAWPQWEPRTDKQTGTFYTDATGALPTMSLEGIQYFFVGYDYDTNCIFTIPIANVKDATIIDAFEKVFTELTEK